MVFLKLLHILSVMLWTSLPQTAPPRLAVLDVQVWPEYDQPSVLVIINGTLADDVALPQEIRLPIPLQATLHAVAYPDSTGNLLALSAATENDTDGQTVVFEVNQPRFVVEYYADSLTPPPARSFTLDIITPYAAEQGTVTVRQPARASNFQADPPMTAGPVDAQGNPTYTLATGPLQPGESTTLQISYTKADATPSVSAQAETAPTNALVTDDSASLSWLPWAAAGIAAGLLAAAAFYWLRGRSQTGHSRQARRRDARRRGQDHPASAAPDRALPAVTSNFCPQCGHPYESSDKFCRTCGAPRR